MPGRGGGTCSNLLLSALARVLPGMGLDPKAKDPAEEDLKPPPPKDPFNHAQVEEWQQRSQSPAAFHPPMGDAAAGTAVEINTRRMLPTYPLSLLRSGGHGAEVTPAAVLEQPESPGPEGIAEQFAFKVASAIFDTDIAAIKKPVGMATHLTYGSLWGSVYGLVQSTVRQRTPLFGALFGLGVWAVGPATLVPAMKLMGKPTEEPPVRTAMMIAGHIVYGVALAEVYDQITRLEAGEDCRGAC
jgi:Protein of unknown function (DUF1440).